MNFDKHYALSLACLLSFSHKPTSLFSHTKSTLVICLSLPVVLFSRNKSTPANQKKAKIEADAST
jgi:hypothetical protein